MDAIELIRSEHRALAAVLVAMRAFVAGVERGEFALDLPLLKSMLHYVTEVPDRVHHPKEDRYLFAALRRRCGGALPVLDRLEDDHRQAQAKWSSLAEALAALEGAGVPGLPAFRVAVETYVDFQWQHMATEERDVLPLARECLVPADWAAIDRAFAANDSPWAGPAGEYRALFARIVRFAPAPIGVGEPWHNAPAGGR